MTACTNCCTCSGSVSASSPRDHEQEFFLCFFLLHRVLGDSDLLSKFTNPVSPEQSISYEPIAWLDLPPPNISAPVSGISSKFYGEM